MVSMKGRKNTAVALFVDGLEVKLAKLSSKRGTVVLEELHTATLVSKLEERQFADTSSEAITETSEAFALPTTETAQDTAGDNNSVLLELLSKYPSSKYVLSYAISEPSIYYHVFEHNFGLKGKKLKLRVLDELRNIRAVQPPLDAIDFFSSAEKNLVCVVREDGVIMLRALDEIKPFLGKRLPRISLIECTDIALMNLARANYGFNPDETTVIIYVGVEFTRLIFLKGSEYSHFAPVLGEGYDSSNIKNTVYSRLLLEQDNMGIPRIDKILLAGESRRIQFDEFIRQQLPEVDVQYLRTPYLNSSSLPTELQEQISEYAVPIATAWKVLEQDHPAFYRVNLLPEGVRESQRTFKLAWHGYLLFVLVFVITFFFASRYAQLQNEVRKKQSTLMQLREKVAANEKMKASISNLNEQIGRYNTALSVYDSLVPGSDRWNRAVSQLAKGVEDLKALWITEVRALESGSMSIQGYSLYRARIPRIAALFDNATLTRVEVKEIRDKTPPVYNFIITVPPQLINTESLSAPAGATSQ
jgi:Tfp pilus assembly protein PilN